jgi:protein subunit release factor A
MAKKKNKQKNGRKKLAGLLEKIQKKKSQIERKTKQLKSLKARVVKILAQNPELKSLSTAAPKSTSRRKKAP